MISPMLLSCVIVDDNPTAVELLYGYCKKNGLNVMLKTTEPLIALEFILKHYKHIDVVYTDIDMPDILGIDFMQQITFQTGEYCPFFVVTTAYPRYVLQEYGCSVICVLEKPIFSRKFKECLEEVYQYCRSSIKSLDADKYITLQQLSDNWQDIIFVQQQETDLFFSLISKNIKIPGVLSQVKLLLPMGNFIQAGHTVIVNRDHIIGLEHGLLQTASGKFFSCDPDVEVIIKN